MVNGQEYLRKQAWVRYGIAVVAPAFACLLHRQLSDWVGGNLQAFVTFFPAVMLTAVLGGLGPGLLATLLSVVAADWWIVTPHRFTTSGTAVEALGLAVFAFMGVCISGLLEGHRRVRDRVAAYEKELALRQSQEALQASEAEFRAIFEVASVGIAQANLSDGRIRQANDKFSAITGYRPEELRSLPFPELTHPEDRAKDRELFARGIRGETANYHNEMRYRRKDGTVIWVRVNAAFLRDAAGQGIRCVVVCEEITEQKLTEKALAFLAQGGTTPGQDFFPTLARFLAETTGMDFVGIVRLDGEALTAQTMAVFSDGQFQENVAYALKDTPCGGLVRETVCCFPAGVRDRFPKDVMLQDLKAESYVGITLRNQAGRPLGLIAVISRRALTNPRIAENLLKLVEGRAAGELERQQAELALRQSETQFRSLFHHSPDAVFVEAEDGTVLDANPAACALQGLPREQLVGQNVQDLVPEEARAEVARQFPNWFAGEVKVCEGYTHQVNGRNVPVELRGAVITYHGRKAVLLQVRDVTDRKQAKEFLLDALAEQRQRHAEVTALLQGASRVLEHHKFQPAAHALHDTCRGLLNATAGSVVIFPEANLDWAPHILPEEIRHLGRTVFENDFPRSQSASLFPPGDVSWKNVLFAPLWLQNKAVGLLTFANKPGGFTKNDARLATAFAELTTVALNHSRALSLLADSEERFRRLAESATDGILCVDAHGHITYWNKGAEQIFGYPAAEILEQSVARLVPTAMQTAHNEAFQQAVKEEKLPPGPHIWEIMGRRRNGQEVALEISLALWKIRIGLSCSAIIRDITERKQAEAGLRRAHDELELRVQERTAELSALSERLKGEVRRVKQKEKELVEAERRYRTVADFTYDWEYWRAPEGRLLYCSPSCERITGYTVVELTNTPDLLAEMVHPEDQNAWNQHACDAMVSPGARTISYRIQRKSGEIRWIEHSCVPVIGSQNEPLGLRASNRDVTHRRQVEMEAEQLRRELARVSRANTAGQLAAALAHELNQPLGAIVCNAQAAGQFFNHQPPPLGEIRDILSDIEADGKRAGEVIHRLRALYQKTSEKLTPVAVSRIIQETVELLHSEFLLKGVSVLVQVPAELPRILGNAIQLQQVIINLIMNALDAVATREAGQRCLRIAAETPNAKDLTISFRDSGSGLAATQIGRLGEPFYTTKPNGMGMGLAISRSIMEAHSGRLWAESNPEGGATFHVVLPLQATVSP